MITRIRLTDGTEVTTDGTIEVQRYPGMYDAPLVVIIRDGRSTGIIPWDKVLFIKQGAEE